MSDGAQIDYEALAKQTGAISSKPAGGGVDYAALAKQAGAVDSQPAQRPTVAEEDLPGSTPLLRSNIRFGHPATAVTPTEFEKERPGKGITTEGMGEGAWETAKQIPGGILKQLDPTSGLFGAGLTSLGLNPRKGTVGERLNELPIVGAAKEAKAGWERGGAPGTRFDTLSRLGEATSSGLGALVGMSGQQAAESGSRGEGGKILGQAAVPATLAAAPLLAKPVAAGARAGYRAIGNPFGLASTGEELLTQGISPRASATSFKASLAKAAPDLKAYHAESPIKNVQDLNDAIPEIKQKIWNNEVEPALNRQAGKPVNMKPVADAVHAQISDEMWEFDEGNATKLENLANKLENARDVTSANKLLKYVNGQLESYFSKYPAARRANLMANPETAGWEAARSELRNQFLGTLEQAGEAGVRDARLRYGALTDIASEVERRVNVADRAKPMSLGRILGLVGAVPTGGLSVAAGELSTYLNKPDTLGRRGLSRLGRGAAPQVPQLLGRKRNEP